VKVITADNVSYAWETRPIVRNFSFVVERGDKIGIVGPNGSGKSTLLKLLLGKLVPQTGTVVEGTGLKVAYFDQTREVLDETATVQELIAHGHDYVEISGQRRHVMTYLQDFLFPPDRARSPVSMLSGGERARLVLARLFAQPFNVLVMDEPTNDLDLETLEMVEDLLVAFGGTLLIVSHDRAFLDNVVTDLFVLDGSGDVHAYVGGYQDYLDEKAADEKAAAQRAAAEKAKADKAAPQAAKGGKTRKFLNRERWELEAIPGEIDALEKESGVVAARLADPATYKDNAPEVSALQKRSAEIEAAMNARFARWEELEALRKELEG
jgi:ATP-binding cassette subfamily F protein uup